MHSQTPALRSEIEHVRNQFFIRAQNRGLKLDYRKAETAARSLIQLRRAGWSKLPPRKRLKELPPTLRRPLRAVCAIIPEVFGSDPKEYLHELDKLDSADALDANRRARDGRLSSTPRVGSAERLWVEENGY